MTSSTAMAKRYAYVWEFHVDAKRQAEFERHYGAEGTWVELFRQAPGYIDTVLLQDRSNPFRYVTIDRWQSAEAYRTFRARFAKQYDDLDRLCGGLTTREVSLGEFEA